MSTLEAIRFRDGRLELLDQLKLPFITEYVNIENVHDGWLAINEMKVKNINELKISNVFYLSFKILRCVALQRLQSLVF